MKPEQGTALGGRYRLVSRVAVGGMGEVWVAHDDALKRDVAVKVLRDEFAGDAGFLERFRAEARNSAQLSHPNIAALYDYGEQDGSGFLVMELVLGEPMSDLLDRQPVLPTRRLLPILAQTARALHAAHVAGVVHRDVKPGNILLARSGRVKITDFGISTAINQVPMTASGMVMGTAQYLSPEQAIGRAATPASDIYSLGIVAYEALVGHRPFTGPTAVDIAVAHVNTPVPPMPGAIDPALSALVMKMLAKEPEARPRSAASLARHLDDLAEATPSDGVPLPYGRHARPVDVAHAGASAERTPTRATPVSVATPVREAGPPAMAPTASVAPAVPGASAQGTTVPGASSTAGVAPATAPTGGSPTATPASTPASTPRATAPSASGGPSGDAGPAAAPPVIPPVVPMPHPSPSGESPVVPVGDELPAHVAAWFPAEDTPVFHEVAAAVAAGPSIAPVPPTGGPGPGAPGGAPSGASTVPPSAAGGSPATAPASRATRRGASAATGHPATRPGVAGLLDVVARLVRSGAVVALGVVRGGAAWVQRSVSGPGVVVGSLRIPRSVLAVVLMVLFALLGAAFADSLWGPSSTDGAGRPVEDGRSARHVTVVTSQVDRSQDGMIQERPAPQG